MRRELRAYGADIESKKEIVALSKCDAVSDEDMAGNIEALRKACRRNPLVLSAVAGIGMTEALYALTREITNQDARDDAGHTGDKQPWSP